ncbi:uncharacterized protein LOC117299221 [Asterias rubens]|uniref:uncharacterized protein LOC117299221 n=1 Tax=Asterias rubens TaxID=7604 RepID=UPI001454F3C1|nr:uncharacterized protein LOC117299221 [Asterias rubens]
MSFPAIEPSTSHSSSSRSSSSSRTSLAQLTQEKAASKGVSATEAKILETLEAILLQVERNSRMLTMLFSNKESLEEREDLPEEVDLPLPTYDSAKDLDQRLAENQTLKKSLIKRLSLIGGATLGKVVRGIMVDLVSTALATQCNWVGQRGPKKPFSVLKNIFSVIIKSVRRNGGHENASQEAVRDAVSNHLRYSFDLDGRGSIRKKKFKDGRTTETTADPSSEPDSDTET